MKPEIKRKEEAPIMSWQYLEKPPKIDNEIVVVTAWGLIDNITFRLIFAIYKPKSRLQAGDIYYSKPEIAAKLVEKIHHRGFKLVLADSLYGKNETHFLGCIEQLKLFFCSDFNLTQRWLKIFPIP